MEILRLSSTSPPIHTPATVDKNKIKKPNFLIKPLPSSSIPSLLTSTRPTLKFYNCMSSSSSTEPATKPDEEIYDWYSQWYPIMPVSDLDKRVPHAKRVMGLDVVVWWDRNDNAWKVFDDMCPHRLAPLSEGRIDRWGRLQCVYHGWCFNGSGDCKFIPQVPLDGPPVHTSKKACVAVYPSTVLHDIVWFWPSTDPQFIDILMKKKPPYLPEFDNPIYTKSMNNRDLPYGYEVLVENFMDPAHSPYAHYGLLPNPRSRVKTADREGGRPIELSVTNLDITGFSGKQEWGYNKFIAPCIFCASPKPFVDMEISKRRGDITVQGSEQVPKRNAVLMFICVPVSPGKSRLIWTFPRNYGSWINRIAPRWIFHLRQNLVLDSDLHLLHLEECKIANKGLSNWRSACYLPAKSDALVIGFRTWLNKYAGGRVDWGGRFSGTLPQTPPREQLLDRYWSHVVNCRSCSGAHKALTVVQIVLQVVSICLIGVVAATKMHNLLSAGLVSMAISCFVASRWLSHFIYKNFHFHDYNHALI